MNPDIRWKQRLENFAKALRLLREALADVGSLSALEKEGAVQRFDFTFELELRSNEGWHGLPARPRPATSRAEERERGPEASAPKLTDVRSRSARLVPARHRQVACATRRRCRRCFGVRVELAWNDLAYSGVVVAPVMPRSVIKQAFAAKIISDGQLWIDMLDCRNLMSHTYDEAVFDQAVRQMAERFLRGLEEVHEFLEQRSGE